MALRPWPALVSLAVILCSLGACHRPSQDIAYCGGVRQAPLRPYVMEQLLASGLQLPARDWGVRFALTDTQGRADLATRPAASRASSVSEVREVPQLLEMTPLGADTLVPLVPCVLLRFDRPVDQDSLRRDARFEVDGQVVRALPVRWDVAERLAPCALTALRVLAENATAESQAFVPELMLPPGESVVFRSGRVRGPGEEASGPEITRSMNTHGPFVVYPDGSAEPATSGWSFGFA